MKTLFRATSLTLFATCDGLYLLHQELFQHLFAVRSKYTKDELEPYLGAFFGQHGQPKDAASLLLLHTRLVDGFYFRK